MAANVGKVQQVIGPTVDLEFDSDHLPEILNAIRIVDEDKGIDLITEVAQHIGNNVVRTIAMDSTDGLVRGMKGLDTGKPIAVPVGDQCLGRRRKRRPGAGDEPDLKVGLSDRVRAPHRGLLLAVGAKSVRRREPPRRPPQENHA